MAKVLYVLIRHVLIWAAVCGLFFLIAGKWGLVAALVLFLLVVLIP